MLIRPAIRSPLRAALRPPFVRGSGGGFSPASIYVGGAKGLWLDSSDISTAFQDSAGTTPVTASGQQVGKRLDKSGLGHHVLQATSSARPEYDLISGIASDYTDGIDDGYSTATFTAGTMSSGMDIFVAVRRATSSKMVLFSQTPSDGTKFVAAESAGASSAVNGLGTAWSVFVNGVQLGSTNSVTRDQLNTALAASAYQVLEIRDIDMSLWTQFTWGLYGSFMLNADQAQLVLCPSQSAAVRAKLRTYVGAKAGLSL